MATTAQRHTPAHLWIVGVLALLWNGFGCYDYLMTMTRNQAYLSNYTADQLAYFEGLPSWLTGFWAIGVWGGLAGAVLLLIRNRYAVWAFVLSLIGAVVTFGYEKMATKMPDSMSQGAMAMMGLVIVVIAAFQAWYSWTEHRKGVLS